MLKWYWRDCLKRLLRIFLVMCFVFVPGVFAKDINHFYASADSDIEFKDTVNGSSVFAGELVNYVGHVSGVNVLAGNKVNYKGQSDYLTVFGNSVNVKGTVVNDTFLAGNIIDIHKDSYLQRDVMIAGSDVLIEGNIGRNITVYGAKVEIGEAVINGNVKIYAENIIIKDSAVILGKVSYPKDAKASISSNITNIQKTSSIKTDENDVFMKFLINKIWSFMGLTVVFAFLTLFVPLLFSKVNKEYKKIDFNKMTELLSKGLVFLIIAPVFSLVSLLIPFGVPLSLLTLALYVIVLYIARIFSAYLIGYKLWQKFINKDINVLLVGLIGIFTLFVLDFIPILNGLITFVCILVGIGMIVELFINRRKA